MSARALARVALPVALYVLVTVFITWPLVPGLSTHLYGQVAGDAGSTVGQYDSWRVAASTPHPGVDFTLDVPYGVHWWEQVRAPLYFVVMYGITMVTGALVAYNLLALLSFPLSALAALLLARRLGLGTGAALAAGLFAGFSSYHLAHALAHNTLAHTEFISLALLAVVAWHEQRRFRWVAATALVIAVALSWDAYYAAFTGLAAGVVYAVLALRRLATSRTLALRIARNGFFACLLAAGASGGAWAWLNSRVMVSTFLAERNPAETAFYSVRACLVLRPWYLHPQLGALGCQVPGLSREEDALYLGVALVLLLVVGAVAWLWRPERVQPAAWHRIAPLGAVSAALVVLGIAISVPGRLTALGNWSPAQLLAALLPGMRVFSRGLVLTQLGLSLLGGAALDVLEARRAGSRHPAWGLVWAFPVFFLFESTGTGIAPVALNAPPAYAVARAHLSPGQVLAESPMAAPGESSAEADLLWHSFHRMPELGLGLAGTVADDLRLELSHAGPDTATELRSLGAGVLITHAVDDPGAPALDVSSDFELLWSDGTDAVWQVGGGFGPFAFITGPLYAAEDDTLGYGRWMNQDAGVLLVNPERSPVAATLTLRLRCASCPRGALLSGDGVNENLSASAGGTDNVIELTLPSGQTRLQLSALQPALAASPTDSRLVSVFISRPHLTVAPQPIIVN
ncbi:MAG: hypothetical protein ACYDAY_01110 [Candidatus Dormibacteria bacterium]